MIGKNSSNIIRGSQRRMADAGRVATPRVEMSVGTSQRGIGGRWTGVFNFRLGFTYPFLRVAAVARHLFDVNFVLSRCVYCIVCM